MYYLYLFITIPTIILMVLFIIHDINHGENNIISTLVLIFLGAPFIGIIIGSLAFEIFKSPHIDNLQTEQVVIDKHKIISLNHEKSQEGKYSSTFFIGSGYVREEHYYVYYKQHNNGDIQFEKVLADRVFLNQNSKEPQVVEYGKRYINVDNNRWLSNFEKKEIRKDRTVIYIPKGTIKENFKIN